jgi:hypothetical protein
MKKGTIVKFDVDQGEAWRKAGYNVEERHEFFVTQVCRKGEQVPDRGAVSEDDMACLMGCGNPFDDWAPIKYLLEVDYVRPAITYDDLLKSRLCRSVDLDDGYLMLVDAMNYPDLDYDDMVQFRDGLTKFLNDFSQEDIECAREKWMEASEARQNEARALRTSQS